MEYINEKYIETKYCCKNCGESDMSPNQVIDYETEEIFVKGWRCNVCGKVNYPIRDILYNNKIKKGNYYELVRK